MPSVVTVRSPARFSVPSNPVHGFNVQHFWKVRVGSECRVRSFVFRILACLGLAYYILKNKTTNSGFGTHPNFPKMLNFEFNPTLSKIGSIPNKLILASIILITQSNFLHQRHSDKQLETLSLGCHPRTCHTYVMNDLADGNMVAFNDFQLVELCVSLLITRVILM